MRNNKDKYRLAAIALFLFLAVPKAGAQDLAEYSDPVAADDSTFSAATDTVATKTDSIKPGAIDAPIHSNAKDSIVLILEGKNMFRLFGKASVKQQDRELTAEYIELDADSSIMYASYAVDSVGEEFGYPVFKEGSQEYEMKRLRFNFKTGKMYIYDVITKQGEGYLTATTTKRMPNEDLNMQNGKYTTCDDHDHPHYYLQMTYAKVRPGKNVVTGPVYLVVEDVPLPIALPFAFFPFSKKYSSGVIMPTFDDEMNRGFSLQNGGYYFAFSDYMDLKLTGEIFTKGSWGLHAAVTYRKRYKFSGNFDAGYTVTVTGDKDTRDTPNSDYSRTEDFHLSWRHSQDAKANPYSTFSANIDFSTSQSRLNNINQYYDYNSRTQNTKSSNVTYSYRHPTRPLSINSNFSISQTSRDTTLSISFPNVTITVSQIYPFKRKEQVGEQRWYEKIYTSYTGSLTNSSGSIKEHEFSRKANLLKWNNKMTHNIPLSASFNLLKHITVNPSVNYGGTFSYAIPMRYDTALQRAVVDESAKQVPVWIHNRFSGSVSLNTKVYGMFKPLPVFGKWTKGVQIRHVFTPNVSFSGSPDISTWGNYYGREYVTNGTRTDTVSYLLYNNLSVPGSGQSATVNFSVSNNIEMKTPIAGTDSTRKISLIDNLSMSMSYNFLADSMNWSDLSASIRIKILGQNLSLGGSFDSYKYDENGRRVNQLRWGLGKGRGFGRFRGTSTSYSHSLNNDVIKKWFAKSDEKSNEKSGEDDEDPHDGQTGEEQHEHSFLRKAKKTEGDYDEDGYLIANIPWNLSFNYSLGYGYGDFNKAKREYDYQITQTASLSGNISPAKGWDFSFSTSYDFDNKRFASLQCNVTRKMHCWLMTASIVPIGPYQSYNFMISVNSSLLKDLKYSQSSNYRDQVDWGE
ncbi:MAG: LPS-assembly protein LptD [Dysgonamonadaceae bacterium]|jgi:hypothetical protein|nr:LPS-assembly protein LptD [Dysgonamonadaceae bacterium]